MQVIASYLPDHILIQIVAVLIVTLSAAFFILFFLKSIVLSRRIRAFTAALKRLKQESVHPEELHVGDETLRHIWAEYCETIHTPDATLNPETGVADPRKLRATLPAEVYFSAQAVFENRLRTEFFKHLPGLLTGLGIIGTFFGLIHGLGASAEAGGTINTSVLIEAVREAFYVSAFAISAAILITFAEKWRVSSLHGLVDGICRDIDALYIAGVGEEYLAQLVRHSKTSATQTTNLKDALVGELSAVLEKITDRQIAASASQQADLRQHLTASIEDGLRQPLGEIASGLGNAHAQQGDTLNQGLKDSMAGFAERLDQMLGGQIGQARELQAQTLAAMQEAARSFNAMAGQVGDAGTVATEAMGNQLTAALEEMSVRQADMARSAAESTEELRKLVAQSHADAQQHVGRMGEAIGNEVAGVLGELRAEASEATARHHAGMTSISQHTTETIDGLAASVKVQSAAIEGVADSVQRATSALSNSVERNIALMADGATRMREAADRFTASGDSVSQVLDQSTGLASELTSSAGMLKSGSEDVAAVVADYRAAREAFDGLVKTLESTVQSASREASMTSELVSQLDSAANKLSTAQRDIDDYMTELSGVLAQVHEQFTNQMLGTVGETNTSFHDHLSKSVGLLNETISELENGLDDVNLRRRKAE